MDQERSTSVNLAFTFLVLMAFTYFGRSAIALIHGDLWNAFVKIAVFMAFALTIGVLADEVSN